MTSLFCGGHRPQQAITATKHTLHHRIGVSFPAQDKKAPMSISVIWGQEYDQFPRVFF